MASSKGFRGLLVNCLLCLERRRDKDPRRLRCNHGFCLQCLKDARFLQNPEAIQCPVCWQYTNLGSGGIDGLPEDDNVAKVEKIVAKRKNPCQGCQSKKKEAIIRCVTCDRLLCQACHDIHLSNPLFEGHNLMGDNLCKIHMGTFSHACFTCFQGVCTDCLLSDLHSGHLIRDRHDAKTTIAKVLKLDSQILQASAGELDKLITMTVEKSEQARLTQREQTVQKVKTCQLQFQRAIADVLDSRDEFFQNAISQSLDTQQKALNLAKQTAEKIGYLSSSSPGEVFERLPKMKLDVYKSVRAARIAQGPSAFRPRLTGDICAVSGDAASGRFDIACCLGRTYTEDATFCMNSPEPKLNISSSDMLPMGDVWKIAALDDGSAVIADWTLNYSSRINIEGKMVARYYTADQAKIRSVATDSNAIYLASEGGKVITQISGTNVRVIRLKPPVGDLCDIAAIGHSLVILGYSSMVKYSLKGEKLELLASCEGGFSRLSIVPYGQRWLYLVTRTTSAQTQKLLVYKQDGESFEKVTSIENRTNGQTPALQGATVVSNGKLLLANRENGTISEYNRDGSLIRHLLTKKHGLNQPRGLGFVYPYIWVTDVQSVQLFQFK